MDRVKRKHNDVVGKYDGKAIRQIVTQRYKNLFKLFIIVKFFLELPTIFFLN